MFGGVAAACGRTMNSLRGMRAYQYCEHCASRATFNAQMLWTIDTAREDNMRTAETHKKVLCCQKVKGVQR